MTWSYNRNKCRTSGYLLFNIIFMEQSDQHSGPDQVNVIMNQQK